MAKALTTRGLPALAVHGDTLSAQRSEAPRRLREREVNVLCTCDLYNEGVDLPYVDTLLLLRPTQSSSLFLQQLGRGLRHHPHKTTCVVLDFIGQHRAEFRFDLTYAALTGLPRANLLKAVEHGFPLLPSGCALQLDAVARDQILSSLRQHLSRRSRVVDDLREVAKGTPVTLAAYLDQTGRDVEDVYAAGGWTTSSWPTLVGSPHSHTICPETPENCKLFTPRRSCSRTCRVPASSRRPWPQTTTCA